MYLQYFRLKNPPFSLAPNPRFLYMSPRHREALAHLLYGIDEGGGFVALTGEVGTGKTTLCRCLLEQIPPNIDIALIINPRLNAIEFLASVCDELRIKIPPETASLKTLVDALNGYLLESFSQGRHTIVIIDEAQNLSFDVLEQIRLLTNLETSESKLLKIILVGQPELNTLLQRKDLRQLNQRITARFHLTPLSETETAGYIYHRLSVSGGYKRLFPKKTIKKIYRYSGGIPRLINIICDRSLLGAYASECHQVSNKIVARAAREVMSGNNSKPKLTGFAKPASFMILMAIAIWGLFDIALPTINRLMGVNSQKNIAVTDSDTAMKIQLGDILTTLTDNYDNPSDQLIKPIEHTDNSLQFRRPNSITHKQNDAANENRESVGKTSRQPSGEDILSTQQLELLINDPKLSLPTALVHLSNRWGLVYSPDFGGICSTAKLHGLRCLTQTTNSAGLAQINRPAILQLSLKNSGHRYVTLIGLQGKFASINFFDNTARNVSFEKISEYWTGEYSIFWKPIDSDVPVVSPGSESSAVQRLRKLLGANSNLPIPTKHSNYFDAALKTRLMEYQKQHGLSADGIAGVMTMISLNTSGNVPGIPKLTKD